jgi:hypothetical protein
MNIARGTRTPRGAVLTAGILLALSGLPITQGAESGLRSGIATLRSNLRNGMPSVHKPQGVTTVRPVFNCIDDAATPGTLRSVIAASAEGDTIDLTSLTCSRITLTQGSIPILFDTLTINGPGAGKLAISGAGIDRIFVHPGYGAFTLSGLTVSNGAAHAAGTGATGGACIASLGYLTLDHSVVTNCVAVAEAAYGGAILAYNLTMLSSTLSNNEAVGKHPFNTTASFGGGAYVNTVALYQSTIRGNKARHDTADLNGGYETGGGIFTNRGGYVLQSTISNNYSGEIGGGISSFLGIDVVGSTISGNTARNGGGGGLNMRPFYGASLRNSTIANNNARLGAGIFLQIAIPPLELQSTIVADNHAAPGFAQDIDAANEFSFSGANNLVQSVSELIQLPSDTISADPLLQPLANHGGPTLTLALTLGSPAIDAGNNVAGLTTDQRDLGFPRIVGVAPDIGAFEGALPPPAPPRPFAPAPALSWYAMLIVSAVLMVFGASRLRRRKSE